MRRYIMPVSAHMMVSDSEEVRAGDVLAKIPRETTKTKDITGGLPRVVELFEARKPKDPAVISEIDGTVKYGGVVKGQRKILIVPDDGTSETREYSIPRGVHVNVQEGERVRAGDPLMDGPSNPHDILHVLGEKELQKYLVNEIQEVYRLQGVNINDKHIEVITRQMMRWVRVEDVGDTEFLVDEQVDRFRFMEENERVIADGGRPATRAAAAARHHQGVALHRVVHLGGIVPGDHARPHRGRDLRQDRLPARPEGERDHGPADPGRHGLLVVPARADSAGRTATAAADPAAERRRRGVRPRDGVPGGARRGARPGHRREPSSDAPQGAPASQGRRGPPMGRSWLVSFSVGRTRGRACRLQGGWRWRDGGGGRLRRRPARRASPGGDHARAPGSRRATAQHRAHPRRRSGLRRPRRLRRDRREDAEPGPSGGARASASPTSTPTPRCARRPAPA